MLFVYIPLLFLGKVLGLTAVVLLLSFTIAHEPVTGSVWLDILAAYGTSFTVLFFDAAVVYPRYRSPLRNLTIVPYGFTGGGRLIVEQPRGKTPLKWAVAHPTAEIFHSRGAIGDSVLFCVGPVALKDLFSTNAYDFVKPQGLRNYLAQFIGYGLIAIEGAGHKDQRRAIHPAFNIKHIRALYPVMWQKAGILVERIGHEMKSKGKIKVDEWASKYAFDVIGRGALSREFSALDSGEYHPVAESFSKCVEPQRWMLHYLIASLSLPEQVVKFLYRRGKHFIERESTFLRKAAEDLLDDAKERPPEEGSILRSIILESSLSRKEIVDNILTFVAAGHETSASSITWACHLLTLPENIHYQAKLRDEVRAAFPNVGGRTKWDASVAELQGAIESCPYLNGFCEEVLRLFPAVPGTLRMSVRQTTIAGTVIPKGQLVVVLPWTINRNPRYWEDDADKFRPERWIDVTSEGTLRSNKNGGAPSNFCEATFLHGPRSCIGRDFARSELKCALAAIFGHYEIKRLDGDDGHKMRIQGQVTIRPRGGLFLEAHPAETAPL